MRTEETFKFERGISTGLSKFSDNVELINQYVLPTPGARTETQLVPIPGSTVKLSIPVTTTPRCRGLWKASTGPTGLATVYGVWGNVLYRINRSNQAIALGYVSSASNLVSWAENQDQSRTLTRGYVCDGLAVYSFDLKATDGNVAATFAEVPMPQLNESEVERIVPAYISYNTYRLIVTARNVPQWWYSELASDTFLANSFEGSESKPDPTIRVVSHGGNLWALSSTSYDIFSYTGSDSDPFDVPSGAVGGIGCASGDSVAQIGDLLFWLGQGETSDFGVFMADVGGKITRVSHAGIENIIRTWQHIPVTQAFAYAERGSIFYVLTSQDDEWTLVYDVTSGLWHQRSTSDDGKIYSWDVAQAVYGYDSLLMGSMSTNELIESDYDQCVDHRGFPVTRLYSGPVITGNLDLFKLLQLKVDLEPGTSQSYLEVPKLFIQLSWDGGKTWSDRMERNAGAMGRYLTEVNLWGGGAGKNLVIRIGTSAPTPLILYGLRLTVEKAGRS